MTGFTVFTLGVALNPLNLPNLKYNNNDNYLDVADDLKVQCSAGLLRHSLVDQPYLGTYYLQLLKRRLVLFCTVN